MGIRDEQVAQKLSVTICSGGKGGSGGGSGLGACDAENHHHRHHHHHCLTLPLCPALPHASSLLGSSPSWASPGASAACWPSPSPGSWSLSSPPSSSLAASGAPLPPSSGPCRYALPHGAALRVPEPSAVHARGDEGEGDVYDEALDENGGPSADWRWM